MKLKIQPLPFDAEEVLALLHQKSAKNLDLRAGDRALIRHGERKIISEVNITSDLGHADEIFLSKEALSFLGIRVGGIVEVSPIPHPKSLEFVLKKLRGEELSKKEIFTIIQEIVSNILNEPEIAYFVSAVYEHGMTLDETVNLTDAICKTGQVLSWKGKLIADKHSIGGIAGNRTTPIVVSICASAGITIPKTSSRAITSAAGTADVMETITHVDFPAKKLQKIVQKTGACLAWGGALGLAPADDKLIRVERLLNIDPESQLIASILAKKLAVGSKYVLIDIPYGSCAKVNKAKAESLRTKFLEVGRRFGLKLTVLLTPGEEPIGNGIGPMLEMRDIFKVLKREDAPQDLEKKSLLLAGTLLEMVGKAKPGKGMVLAQQILDSGAALKKFEQIIHAQGLKSTALTLGTFTKEIFAPRSGVITTIDNNAVNKLGKLLGCPGDFGAGIYLDHHTKALVKKGDRLLTLFAESKEKLEEGIEYLESHPQVICIDSK